MSISQHFTEVYCVTRKSLWGTSELSEEIIAGDLIAIVSNYDILHEQQISIHSILDSVLTADDLLRYVSKYFPQAIEFHIAVDGCKDDVLILSNNGGVYTSGIGIHKFCVTTQNILQKSIAYRYFLLKIKF